MEELKKLLKDEKELIGVLEDHISRIEKPIQNISDMREDFKEMFSIFKSFIKKQEAFIIAFTEKK
jgi:hypothetical protein